MEEPDSSKWDVIENSTLDNYETLNRLLEKINSAGK